MTLNDDGFWSVHHVRAMDHGDSTGLCQTPYSDNSEKDETYDF